MLMPTITNVFFSSDSAVTESDVVDLALLIPALGNRRMAASAFPAGTSDSDASTLPFDALASPISDPSQPFA